MRIIALTRDLGSRPQGMLGAITGSGLVVVVVTLLAGIAFREATMSEIVLLFGINTIMVVGFQAFVGNTGIVSFGHVAFMAIGAYAGGIAAIPADDKAWLLPGLPSAVRGADVGLVPALLVGGAVAALVALVTGIALMRLSGAAASIATLGLLIIVTNVIAQATPITRGPQALFGVPALTTFPAVFASLLLAVVLSAAFKWSGIGLRTRASRDEALAVKSIGVKILPGRITAFVLSAFITGVGGALYAMMFTAFAPTSFFIPQLVLIIAMAVVGGVGSVSGAVVGGAVVTILNESLRRIEGGTSILGVSIELPTGMSAAGLGIALLLTLRLRPQGLLGSDELGLPRLRRPRGPHATSNDPVAEAS